MKGALLHAGVRAKVVLARIEPDDELRQLFAALTALGPDCGSSELIRWVRNPRLLDAHEQVTYGEAMWTASSPVPERRLTGPLAPRPSGAFEHADAPVAALRPNPQGWPLVRH
jgi:hypothetical protein